MPQNFVDMNANFDPLGSSGMFAPNEGATAIDPAVLNKPFVPPSQPMLAPPTMSQKLIAAGLAMIAADKAGMGGMGSVAAGLGAYNDQMVKYGEEKRKETRERLAEYEILGRIRERQMTEMQAFKKATMLERLKKENPEMADLIDLDPEAAAKAIAAKLTPAKPFEGTGIEAQDTNILLQGDPSTPLYAAAFNRQKQQKIMPDGTVIVPDMSAYRLPTFNPTAAGLPGAPAAAPAPAPVPAYGTPGGIEVGTAKVQIPDLDVMEGAKPSIEDSKQVKTIKASHERLQKLLDAREQMLGDNPPIAGSPEAIQLDQNFGQIAAEIKDLKQMGAYDQGVENLTRQILADPVNRGIDPLSPFSSTSKMISQNKGGKAFAKKGLDSARDWVNNTLESELKARGYRLKAAKPPSAAEGIKGAAPGADAPASPKSKAEFDALPKGALFINPADGRTMRKK